MKHLLLILLISTFLFCSNKETTRSLQAKSKIDLEKSNESISKILFSRKLNNDNGWSIYSIDPNTLKEEIVIPFKSGQGEYNTNVSPNGKSISFNTYRYGGWKIASYNIMTKEVKQITKNPKYYFFNGVFSPDGETLSYERNVGRDTHIFKSDSNGDNEERLTINFGKENRTPSWSADGKSVFFYSEKDRINDIYVLDITSKKIKNISNNKTGNDFNPCVSQEGKKVAYYSDRNGYLDVYVMDIDGQNQINLTESIRNDNNKYNYYTDYNMFWKFKVSWSPDGKSLVFSNAIQGNIDLFTIHADGTNLKQITKTPKSEYTPEWAIISQ